MWMEFPLEFFDGLSSGGVLRGPSTAVDARRRRPRRGAPRRGRAAHARLADGATATSPSSARAAAAAAWAAPPASARRATVEYLRSRGRRFAVERADTASLPLPPFRRRLGRAAGAPARRCFARGLHHKTTTHPVEFLRCPKVKAKAPLAAIVTPRSPSAPEPSSTRARPTPSKSSTRGRLGAEPGDAGRRRPGRPWRPLALAVAVHGDVACTFPRLGAGRVVDVDDVDAEGCCHQSR